MPLPKQTDLDELVGRFRVLGWEGPVGGGKHRFMKKGKHKVHIPSPHRGRTVGAGLLKEMLKQADITEEQWLQG